MVDKLEEDSAPIASVEFSYSPHRRTLSPADFRSRVPTGLWLAAEYVLRSGYALNVYATPLYSAGCIILPAIILYYDYTVFEVGRMAVSLAAIFTFLLHLYLGASGTQLARFHREKGTLHYAGPVGRFMHAVDLVLNLPNHEPRHDSRDTIVCGCRKCIRRDMERTSVAMWATTMWAIMGWALSAIVGTLGGLVDPKGGVWNRFSRIAYIIWSSVVTMGLTTGAVHAARVGTVFILLAKLESDQRQLQDSLHRNLFALSDLRYPSLDQIRFPTTTLHKDESSEYDRAHWNLGQTLANEKRQLEGIVGVTAMATAVDFVAFFVIALCSGCVPAYWISQAFVHLSYFIALFHVIGLFNSNASKANRIVQRAERELAFIIFDLVQARNALAGHPSSHAKSQYSAQTWNGWTRQDSDLSNGNSSNSSGTYLNGDPESTSDPHISVFVETLKSTVNSYQSTLPSFGKREQLSGRSYPLILRDGMAVPREIVESRLREAKAQAKVLEKMALQSSMDENLGKFLGMTMTFESARIFTFSAVMAVVVGYQLFKSGGYSFALAYSCGA